MNSLPQPNGDLPPSTIAAQLVNSLTRGQQYPNYQDRADFECLLQIFETEQDGEQHAGTHEEAEESAKLIDVVIKAGLDALLRDNPFESQDTLVTQASRSLGVMDITIKRCPEVLFFRGSQQEADSELCGPLYLWLVPKLLIVDSIGQNQVLHAASTKVLHSIIAVEREMRSKGPRLHHIHRYIIGCTRGKMLRGKTWRHL